MDYLTPVATILVAVVTVVGMQLSRRDERAAALQEAELIKKLKELDEKDSALKTLASDALIRRLERWETRDNDRRFTNGIRVALAGLVVAVAMQMGASSAATAGKPWSDWSLTMQLVGVVGLFVAALGAVLALIYGVTSGKRKKNSEKNGTGADAAKGGGGTPQPPKEEGANEPTA